MSSLYDSVTEIGKYFTQKPSVCWTLMQTTDNGRRAYTFFVVDHDPPFVDGQRDVPAILCNLTSTDLGDLSDDILRWLRQHIRKGN